MKRFLTYCKRLLQFILVAAVIYCGAYTLVGNLQKGYNPWVVFADEPDPPNVVQPTSELLVSPDTRFVDVIEVENPKTKETTSAALLADNQGRTALLPQTEEFPYLTTPQRLAVSVLSQWQPGPLEGQVASTRRFKNTQTGEFRDFAPNQYPSDPHWVPVGQ